MTPPVFLLLTLPEITDPQKIGKVTELEKTAESDPAAGNTGGAYPLGHPR